jgi:site-specific recombinase XerD
MTDNKQGISIHDFMDYLETYLTFRLKMHNQPSGVTANKRDLNLFVAWCTREKIRSITGPVFIDFLSYLRDERENSSGAINRKRASLITQ